MDKANRKRKKNSLVLELIIFKEFIILNGFSVQYGNFISDTVFYGFHIFFNFFKSFVLELMMCR